MMLLERTRICRQTDPVGRAVIDINRVFVHQGALHQFVGINDGPWIEVVVYAGNAAAAGIVEGHAWSVASASFAVAIRRGRTAFDQIRHKYPRLPRDLVISVARLAAGAYSKQVLKGTGPGDFRLARISLSKAENSVWILTFRETSDQPRVPGARSRQHASHEDSGPLALEVRVAERPESWSDLRVSVRAEEAQVRIRRFGDRHAWHKSIC
jgi:hypothetical protein